MKNKNELSYKDLKITCNPDLFNFESTQELEPIRTGIGQDRGISALEFGIQIDVKGYNLYLEGPGGVGKTMYTKNYLNQISTKKKTPSDWCYIYNFENPNEPISVSLPAGQGKEFKESMDDFIKEIKKDIKKTFNADDFEKEKALIKKEFEEQRSILMEELNENASKYNFQVKSAQNGILKSEAVFLFAKVLNKYGIDYFQDMPKLYSNYLYISEEIMQIPGQRSGISLKYFLMLAGNDNLIKPDRQILSFLKSILNENVSIQDAQALLQQSCEILKKEYPNLNLRLLDHLIWNYQRSI